MMSYEHKFLPYGEVDAALVVNSKIKTVKEEMKGGSRREEKTILANPRPRCKNSKNHKNIITT